MQIVINKVENGYICTLNGKMYVFKMLEEVAVFMYQTFDEPIVLGILEKMIVQHIKENESLTSNSSEV